MRETELKAALPDEEACVTRLVAAGARRGAAGRLEDRRYDTPDHRLVLRDQVLRLRVFRSSDGVRATLDWKGPASFDRGFKHREETSVPVGDADAMVGILAALGYVVTREIDRDIQEFTLGDAKLRVERYARMDTLLEVEGPEPAIEAAIAASGLPRTAFVPDRLFQFVQRYEARTGERAAICAREARGDYPYALTDA